MQKSIRIAAAFFLLLLPSAVFAGAQPRTLEDVYQAALRRSETIGEQVELINQAEEVYHQAIGAVLPNVTAAASYLHQPAPAGASNFFPTDQPLVRITADQPIFRGLREFAALRQTKDQRAAQVETAQQARTQLWYDVSTNFYNILSYEKDLADLADETQLYLKRIHDLNAWIKIGRSRQSDVLTVQASLASLNAQVEQTRGLLNAARQAFAFLTGLPSDTPIADVHPLLTSVEPVETYLARLDDRPDVKSASYNNLSAQENVRIAEGARWPSIDVLGDYYPYRYGPNSDVHWDVQVQLSVPLYTGGSIDSKIRQAASQERQSDLVLSGARRAADEEIRTAYVTYQSDQRQMNVLRLNREISERNYRVQSNDYRLGLVTNLDVLTALTSFVEAERALDRAIFTAKNDLGRLETASFHNTVVNQAKTQ